MKDKQIVGNIGLYYVCFKLSGIGWNAMPTSRNARGVDIIAYNSDCSKKIGLQVKTLTRKNPVPLGISLDRLMGDFWIIVNDIANSPKSYIMRPREVKKLAHRGEKGGRVSYWLQPSAYCIDRFLEAWDRIGLPNQSLQRTDKSRH